MQIALVILLLLESAYVYSNEKFHLYIKMYVKL